MSREEKTSFFRKEVERLINTGEVRSHAEIINAIGWGKSMFSQVIRGVKPIPIDKYLKFLEVYQIPNPEQNLLQEPDAQYITQSDLSALIQVINNASIANKDVAAANRLIAETSKDAMTLLKSSSAEQGPGADRKDPPDFLKLAFERVAQEGAKTGYWRSAAEGKKILERFLKGEPVTKEALSR